MSYRIKDSFSIECGFAVTSVNVLHAANATNHVLAHLPPSLFRSIDFKTTSSIVGAVFCEHLAEHAGAIVNPIEKGHPDILPATAAHATEENLRNYHCGLEVKSTIGNVETGLNLRAGVQRVGSVTGITWQAHHRDVHSLLGLTWDFVQEHQAFNFPGITGAFFAPDLDVDDWGEISGTTGRNTKVCGMKASGRAKMGAGWILLWEHDDYADMFGRYFPETLSNLT